MCMVLICVIFFFFQAEDGIRDSSVTGVQTCALPIFKCAPVDAIASRRQKGLPATDGSPFGIALPLDAFRTGRSHGKSPFQNIQPWNSEVRPSIITTACDVPVTTEMKHLIKVFEGIPRAI